MVRREAERHAALDDAWGHRLGRLVCDRRETIQSAVAAALCRRSPKVRPFANPPDSLATGTLVRSHLCFGNARASTIAYDDLRALFRTFLDDLTKAEETLALVEDDAVKLPIRFGLVRLDLDGDGKATDEEILWKLYARLNRQAGRDQPDGTGARVFRSPSIAAMRRTSIPVR